MHPSKQAERVRPIYREVLADLETPLTAYLKIAGHPSFLLESVEQGEQVARYSFIGTGERQRIEARGRDVTVTTAAGSESFRSDDPLQELWQRVVRPTEPDPKLPAFWAGAVGYASYDLARLYLDLPDKQDDEIAAPDLLFIEPELVIIFDHLKRKLFITACAKVDDDADEARARALVDAAYLRLRSPLPGVPGDRAGRLSEFSAGTSREEYMAAVSRSIEEIRAGEVAQVVPSMRLSADLGAHPFAIYRALRVINPSPFLGHLDLGPVTLVASSPESMVRVGGERVETRPIAGTRPRGASAEEDAALRRELLADAKELSEHQMLVDLSIEELTGICDPPSVRVSDLMRVERYSHVMHIVSVVEGTLANGRTSLDALAATMPMGTASGAPKRRAIEIIDELETQRRGPYAGAFGYLSVEGDMDMALTLRTMVVKDGRIHLQAGAGVVAESDPAREYQECLNKLAALRRAVEMATDGLG